MVTRHITGFELCLPDAEDHIVFEINPVRMTIADAPRIAQAIETVVNLGLGRDAVRVQPMIARLDELS
jgi:hypothetical protein